MIGAKPHSSQVDATLKPVRTPADSRSIEGRSASSSSLSSLSFLGRIYSDVLLSAWALPSCADLTFCGGGDVRSFHVPTGKFEGIIGGPPCQFASKAALTGSEAPNLIPEYLRLIEEAKPQWAVMENVEGVLVEGAGPDWPYTVIRDWDCGGMTNRERVFWFRGIAPVIEPQTRPGKVGVDIERTVLASSWKSHSTPRFPKLEYVKGEQAAELQGFPGLGEKIMNAQPSYGGKSGLSDSSRNILAVHMLGNGVPRAMGEYVARHVKRQVMKGDEKARTDLPPYPMFAALR